MNKSPIRTQTDVVKNIKGEQIAQGFMDDEYKSLGYQIVDRYGNKGRDLVTSKSGNKYKVEEKFRKKDYGDFLVEIMQCMIIKDMGWFYKTEADILSYVICSKSWVPQRFYLIDWTIFPDWFLTYLKNNNSPTVRLSSKGIGLTLNVAIRWIDIPPDICRSHLANCRKAPWNRNGANQLRF